MADDSGFVRIKDTETGNEFTAAAESHYAQDKSGRFKKLDKDAVDIDGRPLAPKNDPLKRPAKATADELRQFAADNGVDLGDAKTKADIEAAIDRAQEA